MTSITTDRYVEHQPETGWREYPVKADENIPRGAAVGIEISSGYAVDLDTLSAGVKFAGIAAARADNTDGSNGDVRVKTITGGTVDFAAAGLTAASLFKTAYLKDNVTITTVSESYHVSSVEYGVVAGDIVEVLSATRARVAIAKGINASHVTL